MDIEKQRKFLKRSLAALLLSVPLLMIGVNQNLSFAQSELSLDDFLKQNESILDAPSEENRNPIPLQSAEENDGADGEALPEVPTSRLRVEDAGFENGVPTGLRMSVENNAAYQQQTSEELAEEIRQEAFDAAITGLFPLRPENIKSLLREYDITRRAAEEPINGIPTPEVKVETLSLDPGVKPMVLKTATGHITTLNILDATGAPWPIQDVGWAGDFEVIEPEEGGHIVRITPMSIAAYGNMSIRLLELQTPVTIMLTTNKDEVQYRVDARIPEKGPFAEAQLIDGGIERVAGNSTLMSVLDGVPPNGSEKLDVSGVDGRTSAYQLNGKTYVRTPLTLLSPGWDQSVSSADGMNVYTLNETPVLLLSDKGRFTRANLTPGKDLLNE